MVLGKFWVLGLGLSVMLFTLVGCASGDGIIKQANAGAPEGTGMSKRMMQRGDRTRMYGLFIPVNYSPDKKWPVIVFLHGVGEGGSNASDNLTVGLGPVIAKSPKTFPFIAVFPQSASGRWPADSDQAEDIVTILDSVSKSYNVDQDRVILTGLSTGGFGTWTIGAKYRDRFAALVPMCAYSSQEDIPKLTQMPIWAFHNSADPFVLSSSTEDMVAGINRQGGRARMTIYSAMGHDCWIRAYGDPELYQWMLAQRRNLKPMAVK
jgi:predicted peptidase